MLTWKKILAAYCALTLIAAFGLNRWVASTWDDQEPIITPNTISGVLTVNGPRGIGEFRGFLAQFAEQTGSRLSDSTDRFPPRNSRPFLFVQVRHGDVMEFTVNNILNGDRPSFGLAAADPGSSDAAVLIERMVHDMKERWPDLRSRR